MSCTVQEYVLAFPTNSTATGYPYTGPSVSQPSGYFWSTSSSGSVPEYLVLVPFGAGSAGQQFTMRVVGWRKTVGGVWVPTVLLDATCTLSNVTGVALDLPTSVKLCNTVSVGVGTAGYYLDVVSSTQDIPCQIWLHTKACAGVTIQTARTTATSANCLLALT